MPFAKFSPGCPCCNSSTQYCLVDCNGKYLTPSVLFPSGSIEVFVEGSGGVLNTCLMPSGTTCCSTFIPTNSGVSQVMFSGGGYASFIQINNTILSQTDILGCCNHFLNGDTVWAPIASSFGPISVNFIIPHIPVQYSYNNFGEITSQTTYDLIENISFNLHYNPSGVLFRWQSDCIYAGKSIGYEAVVDVFGRTTGEFTGPNYDNFFYGFYLDCDSVVWSILRNGSFVESGLGTSFNSSCKSNLCGQVFGGWPPAPTGCSIGFNLDCMQIRIPIQSINYNPYINMGSLNITPFISSRDVVSGPYSCSDKLYPGSIPYSGIISYSLLGAM